MRAERDNNETDSAGSLRHVHDLPQLWQKPSAEELLQVLNDLSSMPADFQATESNIPKNRPGIEESGVPAYLTSIVASRLGWIGDENIRETIWELASVRLSERSGRTAMPAMTRSFVVTTNVTVKLHEPSLTEDNLGLKTWASSLLLSKQLSSLAEHLPETKVRVLELGAGTGLVGISAACIFHTSVVLTDLPEIVPNLQHNLDINRDLVAQNGGSTSAMALDWADASCAPSTEDEKFAIVIAADPIYSPEHPKLLVDTISRWLSEGGRSRVVIELPRRPHYTDDRAELECLLIQAGLANVANGVETGFDDWLDESGDQAQVDCEYSVWKRSS